MTMNDFTIVTENQAKCEHARQGLVDLYEELSTEVVRDENGQPFLEKETNRDMPDNLLPHESKAKLQEFKKIPIEDPRIK